MSAAKIKKGDQVVVLSGRDRGKKGEVFHVSPKEGRALVRGVNVVRKHQRQSGASAAYKAFLSFKTTQRLFLEIGRLSSMKTRSPTLNVSSSSWAWNFFERRTAFLNSGCMKRRSTSTTTVLVFLSETTTPCKTRFGIA